MRWRKVIFALISGCNLLWVAFTISCHTYSLVYFSQTVQADTLFYFSTYRHLLEVLVNPPCLLINCGYVSIWVRIYIGVSITTVHRKYNYKVSNFREQFQIRVRCGVRDRCWIRSRITVYLKLITEIWYSLIIVPVHSIGVSLRLSYCADIHGNHIAHGFLTIEAQFITINCSETSTVYRIIVDVESIIHCECTSTSALLVRHYRVYQHVLVFELRFLSQVWNRRVTC